MKKTFVKLVSIILVLCMTLPIMASAAVAGEVSRVSVTINGDASTSRGFCWYTDEKAGSDVQICPVGKDLSKAEDTESVYEIVSDENELNAVAGVFEDLLEDVQLV